MLRRNSEELCASLAVDEGSCLDAIELRQRLCDDALNQRCEFRR
jgi:hypothetical protein